jgi:hypothetical protein
MTKPTWHRNDRRIDQLEKLFEAADDERYQPIDQVALAIIEEVEGAIRGPDDPGPRARDREFFALAVARALEKCGRTTAQIAEELDLWMEAFGEEPLGGGGGST